VKRWRDWLFAPGAAAGAFLMLVAVLFAGLHFSASRTLPGAPNPYALDYSTDSIARINPLNSDFVRSSLGAATASRFGLRAGPAAPQAGHQPSGASRSVGPSSARPTESPGEPGNTITIRIPFIPGPNAVAARMTPDRTTVAPGGDVVYTVTARNDGTESFSGTMVLNSHAPLFAGVCLDQLGLLPCIVPGLYDGSSQSASDLHLLPPPVDRAVTIPPGQERVVMTVRITVYPTTPAGTLLHNHVHVAIPGGARETFTVVAPVITVR
jgi:hypothetical protein